MGIYMLLSVLLSWFDFSTEMSEKEILNEAVENLQERIEIILALLTEEMGFELLSWWKWLSSNKLN
mgnify:CR=1 FL=1